MLDARSGRSTWGDTAALGARTEDLSLRLDGRGVWTLVLSGVGSQSVRRS